ncbi:unnamed protein product [Urochloa humidicola]
MAAAAAAAAPRCLSDLLDELLLHILSFLPAKDAAATAVLSRRWRSLWLTSGTVYLDSSCLAPSSWRSDLHYSYTNRSTQDWDKDREGFLHAVHKALAAAGAAVPITRLTFVVKTDSLVCRPDMLDHGLVAAALSMPASRRVEEIRVENYHRIIRPLGFGSLPCESLRVLHLVGVPPMAVAPPAAAAFPWLEHLQFHDCTVPIVELQPIVDASPWLATLHLESCCITEKPSVSYTPPGTTAAQAHRLVCPSVTALVFERCNFQSGEFCLELDAPRLQSFRYFGAVQLCDRLSLNPIRPPLSVIQVADLHLINDHHAVIGVQVCLPSLFWRFIRNFRTAKVLKLKLDFSMDRVVLNEMSQQDGEHTTTTFRNLERLELDAQCLSMAMLAGLLRGCPRVRDLRLKLREDTSRWMNEPYSIDQEARADFDKSVDRFRHRKTPMRPQLGGKDHDHKYYEASYIIPVLSEQSFSCLESSLRSVSLQFCMDEPNCLGVQLAKFFAKNARVLEEMHIDDGSHKLCEHMNASVSEMDC